jgi:predicted nucleic acid-binding protein
LTVAECPAVNASPLIFLARAGLLELLKLEAQEIAVSRSVAEEIRHRGPDDITVRAMETETWLKIMEDLPVPDVLRAWDLGEGESAVLAWGYANPGTVIIVDDLAARRCAATYGIPVRGTLGLVLTAKKRGVIPQARPVLERLRQSGMYLSDLVLNQALALVGE